MRLMWTLLGPQHMTVFHVCMALVTSTFCFTVACTDEFSQWNPRILMFALS